MHQIPKRPQPLAEKVNWAQHEGRGARGQGEHAAREPRAARDRNGSASTLGTSIGDLKLNLDRSSAPCTGEQLREPGEGEDFDNTDLPPPRGDLASRCWSAKRTRRRLHRGPGLLVQGRGLPGADLRPRRARHGELGPWQHENALQFFIVVADGANPAAEVHDLRHPRRQVRWKKVDEVAKTGAISGVAGSGAGRQAEDPGRHQVRRRSRTRPHAKRALGQARSRARFRVSGTRSLRDEDQAGNAGPRAGSPLR